MFAFISFSKRICGLSILFVALRLNLAKPVVMKINLFFYCIVGLLFMSCEDDAQLLDNQSWGGIF